MQSPPYLLPLLLTALLSTLLAAMLWRRRRAPGAGPLAVLMGALAFWALTYMAGLAVTALEAQIFWANLTYFSIVLIPLTWLIFAMYYTGHGHRITRRLVLLLLIMPLLTVIMVWTNERPCTSSTPCTNRME